MHYLLALVPILVVLGLMIFGHWGAHRAGVAGLAAGVVVAAGWFGLTPAVLWVCQAKGLLLSLFVLAVMWPALFLYHWNDQGGGIGAVARLLETAIPDPGMCRVLLAWSLSGLLEGLAGFGLPIAAVAPMLTALGVPPLQAVGAVAVGHCWAVSFGSIGVVVQTLGAVVGMESSTLVPYAALLLGLACLLCGLGAAAMLGELRRWPRILPLALVIGGTQYGLAVVGLIPLSAFGAGLAGLTAYALCARLKAGVSGRPSARPRGDATPGPTHRTAWRTIADYGALTLLMAAMTMVAPLRAWGQGTVWKASFPEVVSRRHFSTPAASGQVFRPWALPGTMMLAVAAASIGLSCWREEAAPARARRAARATWRSAGAASVGVLSMVGLSTIMDHCGMSYLVAQGLSRLLGKSYPIVSPWVGILGAFATGSNNNSNVLFGSLQKNVALLIQVDPRLLVAAQTTGGALGSMLAPVKVILGCSTVGVVGQDGSVLRKTVPLGLAFGLIIGLVAWAFA